MAKMGRPTKLTPEIQARICDFLRSGHYMAVAATAAGICAETLTDWLARGRNGEEPYDNFFEAVEQAKVDAENLLLKNVVKASDKDWQAAKWVLSRRWSKRWADREQLEVSGEVTVKQDVVDAIAKLRAKKKTDE